MTENDMIPEGYGSSQLLNSSFYSSNSGNALDHSRNFRNSLVLDEFSEQNLHRYLEEEEGDITSGTTHSQRSNQNDNYDWSYKLSPQKRIERPTEVRTVNMTASPSLSALVELLNEKSKTAEQRMKSQLITEVPIIEEDEKEEEVLKERNEVNMDFEEKESASKPVFQNSSPNLIDIDGEENNFVTNLNPFRSFEEPDFMTTPKVQQKPQLSEKFVPTDSLITEEEEEYVGEENHETEGYNDNIGGSPVDAVSMSNINVQSAEDSDIQEKIQNKPNFQPDSVNEDAAMLHEEHVSKTQEPSINIPKKTFATRKYKKPVRKLDSASTDTKEKKRSSFFSFFKKKSAKDPKTESSLLPPKRSKATQSRPRSYSLGTKSQLTALPNSRSISENVQTQPSARNNKFSSSLSLFGDVHEEDGEIDHGTIQNLHAPQEQNKKSVGQDADTNDTVSPPKRLDPLESNITLDNYKSNPSAAPNEESMPFSPIDSGNIEQSASGAKDRFTTSTDLAPNDLLPMPPKISPALKDTSSYDERRDSGEVYFPKSLNEDEIDCIIQLERNRSLKSVNQKISTDTLSVKAQSEGMTVEEASDVVLANPDLSKSPSNSILKNTGRFENLDPMSNGLSSLKSFDGKMDQLSLDTDRSTEEKLTKLAGERDITLIIQPSNSFEGDRDAYSTNHQNKKVKNTGQHDGMVSDSKPIAEVDPELMTDIMEFANIINFGDEINFDLDINEPSDTFAYDKVRTLDSPVLKPPQMSHASNHDIRLTFHSPTEETPVEKKDTVNEQFINDDFENEEFNDEDIYESLKIKKPQKPESQISSPHMEEYISHSYHAGTSTDRPISMSFKGLTSSMNHTESSENLSNNQRVNFSSKIILYDTYSGIDYDRRPDISTCNQLTPQLAQMIKSELNDLKASMEVHQDSRCYTQFF
ncbi:Bni4p KNAG_0F00810 [Huiozyma naganishii CBS 8797]|uniref:Protein BNI4 n=1 Tax=Huiozyma naganishii (strain ATCC MYA-139 / BCRC 22969 / CBS 8797 / KCTC 17520 / NBRC 10181 / NCYC 3082 / Yp74L-3) TaxID=1071383 RepID=J7R7A9_HUIN7|nr:hypothetical protein KNAG_0F00810 [Kazachstania naganishii CBS 8797]CCK70750.1 hypothetical protein KNAG_0F00810 [Kazachstania naganishii CBS 8797]